MYLSLKSLIGWIINTPSLMFVFKLGLFQFLYKFLYKIIFQTIHVYNHSTPFLLKIEGIRLVCSTQGRCKRQRQDYAHTFITPHSHPHPSTDHPATPTPPYPTHNPISYKPIPTHPPKATPAHQSHLHPHTHTTTHPPTRSDSHCQPHHLQIWRGQGRGGGRAGKVKRKIRGRKG